MSDAAPTLSRAQRRAMAKAPSRSSPPSRRRSVISLDPVKFGIAGACLIPKAQADAFLAEMQDHFEALRIGVATVDNMFGLFGIAQMVQSLCELGSRGRQRYSVSDPRLVERCVLIIELLCPGFEERGRFVARGPDLQDFGALVECHASLYRMASQSDLEEAARLMVARCRSSRIAPSLMRLQGIA